jgi:hypothetical protein
MLACIMLAMLVDIPAYYRRQQRRNVVYQGPHLGFEVCEFGTAQRHLKAP